MLKTATNILKKYTQQTKHSPAVTTSVPLTFTPHMFFCGNSICRPCSTTLTRVSSLGALRRFLGCQVQIQLWEKPFPVVRRPSGCQSLRQAFYGEGLTLLWVAASTWAAASPWAAASLWVSLSVLVLRKLPFLVWLLPAVLC